jgi:peptidyl-tRNA hydrolase
VLQDFSQGEQETLKIVLQTASEAAQFFARNGLEQAMNQFNGAVSNE